MSIRLKSGKYRKGLFISEGNFSIVLFNPEERPYLVKFGSNCRKPWKCNRRLNPEPLPLKLLQGEIDRIHARKKVIRTRREKVQLLVQEKFMEQLITLTSRPSGADHGLFGHFVSVVGLFEHGILFYKHFL